MANNVKKVSKKDKYTVIAAILEAAESAGMTIAADVTYGDLQDFVAHEIELLDNKAVAAKARAATKKAEGDALRDKIYGVLTDEAQPIAAIVAALGDPDVSAQMVTARLTQLKNLDMVTAEEVTVNLSDGKTRKASGYRLA